MNTALLIKRARSAVAWSAYHESNDLLLSGSVEYLGVKETFQSSHATDGRFQIGFDGPLSRDSRFDGKTVQLAEFCSLWDEQEFFGREAELLRAWVHSGYWLHSRAPLLIESLGSEEPEGPHVLAVTLFDGLLDARVELHRYSHLAESLTLFVGGEELRTEFSDFRKVEGVQIAHEIRSEQGMGNRFVQTVEGAQFQPTLISRFTRVSDESDFRFVDDGPAEVAVTRSESGHLWVRPLVNGKDVGLFLFDTGAGFSGISAEAAEALALESFGRTAITGMGGELTPSQMRRSDTLQLGPLIIDDLVFSEIDVARKSKMVGQKVAGVLGWDVMRRAVVEFEPGGNVWLFEPAAHELEGAKWSPLNLHYKVPFVGARFSENRSGLFMLDSGAGGVSVAFFHHSARRLGFLEEGGDPTSTGRGAGGSYGFRTRTLPWFEFAGDRVTDLTAMVSTGEDGESDPYTMGLIGGELLQRYRLVFDYKQKRIAMIPK